MKADPRYPGLSHEILTMTFNVPPMGDINWPPLRLWAKQAAEKGGLQTGEIFWRRSPKPLLLRAIDAVWFATFFVKEFQVRLRARGRSRLRSPWVRVAYRGVAAAGDDSGY